MDSQFEEMALRIEELSKQVKLLVEAKIVQDSLNELFRQMHQLSVMYEEGIDEALYGKNNISALSIEDEI